MTTLLSFVMTWVITHISSVERKNQSTIQNLLFQFPEDYTIFIYSIRVSLLRD